MEDGAKNPPRLPRTPEEKLRHALLSLQVHQVSRDATLYPPTRVFLLDVLARRRRRELERWERSVIKEFEDAGVDLAALDPAPSRAVS